MALPPRLEKEVQELRDAQRVDIAEDGDYINLVLPAFALGEGFSVATSDLLIRVQRSYPDAGPDMFWVDVSVLLANGQAPQAAEVIETHAGRNWRRFSWHRKGWNPSVDNLDSYIEFIRRRLKEKK